MRERFMHYFCSLFYSLRTDHHAIHVRPITFDHPCSQNNIYLATIPSWSTLAVCWGYPVITTLIYISKS